MPSERERIETGRDVRFVRRDERGRFTKVVDAGRSLADDRRQRAKTNVPGGQGGRGDQARRTDR
jgi:hypothetical protein